MAEDPPPPQRSIHVVMSQDRRGWTIRRIFLCVLTDESAAKLRQLMIQESDPSPKGEANNQSSNELHQHPYQFFFDRDRATVGKPS